MRRYFCNNGIKFLLAIILLMPSFSFATDYYVDAYVGSNANSGLQPDDAFGDLIYATKQLQPGDTLYLRAGTYVDAPLITSYRHKSGTATKPITLRPYLDQQPIISGTSTFLIKDVSWWIIRI